MTKETKILYGVIAVVVIILILFIVRTFRKDRIPESANMEVIKAKDESIQILKDANRQLEEVVKGNIRRDSIYSVQLQNNQPKYIINERSLQNVPVVYRDISKDQLRKRAIEY